MTPNDNAPLLTLYYSPAAISFVTHIALEEAGLDFALCEIDIFGGAGRAADYLSLNPLGRVPTVRLGSGEILTEVPAILGFIADQSPSRDLLPRQPWPRAKASEWMSLCSSSIHPAFLGFFRPERYTDAAEAHPALARDSRTRFFGLLELVDRSLPDGGFVLGDRYSLCDPYVAIFFMWGRFFGFPVESLARYAALFGRVAQRSAFQKAFAREGIARIAEKRRAAPAEG